MVTAEASSRCHLPVCHHSRTRRNINSEMSRTYASARGDALEIKYVKKLANIIVMKCVQKLITTRRGIGGAKCHVVKSIAHLDLLPGASSHPLPAESEGEIEPAVHFSAATASSSAIIGGEK